MFKNGVEIRESGVEYVLRVILRRYSRISLYFTYVTVHSQRGSCGFGPDVTIGDADRRITKFTERRGSVAREQLDRSDRRDQSRLCRYEQLF